MTHHYTWQIMSSAPKPLDSPSFLKTCLAKAVEFYAICSPSSSKPPRVPINIKWLISFTRWIKLNPNGSSFTKCASGGGLLRDHSSNWLTGFSHAMGSTSSILAELWALHDGLSLAIIGAPLFCMRRQMLNSLLIFLAKKIELISPWNHFILIARAFWRDLADSSWTMFFVRLIAVLMHWVSLEPILIKLLFCTLTHRLWWLICLLLT